MGAYNSISYVFDSLRGTVTKSTPESRRSIADEQSGSKLGDDDLTPSEQLKERPSRIFVGVAANKTISQPTEKDKLVVQMVIQMKHYFLQIRRDTIICLRRC